MATKDELVAFANANGVDVDASWLKADIEAALSDAGFDPNNLGASMSEEPMTTEEMDEHAEYLVGTSSDARFSTKTEVEPDPDIRPAPGRQVDVCDCDDAPDPEMYSGRQLSLPPNSSVFPWPRHDPCA